MTLQNNGGHDEPIMLLGSYHGKAVPEELYGILGALLIRSLETGKDLAEVLRDLDLPLPDRPYYVMILTLDQPHKQLPGVQRHRETILQDRKSVV